MAAQTSVVVVSHDPGSWLATCLASVADQADEVLVVDNGSPDEGVSRIAKGVGARCVRSSVNTGFATGANLGVAQARGEIIALLNDDAVAGENWIDGSRAELERNGDIAAVIPKLLLARRYAEILFDDRPHWADGDPRPLGRRIFSITVGGTEQLPAAVGPGLHRPERGPAGQPNWRWTTGPEPIYVPLPDGDAIDLAVNGQTVEPRAVVDLVNNAGSYLSQLGYGGDYGNQTPDRGAFNRARDCFAASGAALVTTRDIIRRIGRFAGYFFLYYEDTDWSWRAQLAGMRIRYEPRLVVRHLKGATTGGERNARVQFCAARNRLLMLTRNAPLPIVARELRAASYQESWPLIRRSVVKRSPQALAQRWQLTRCWHRSPDEVWRQWAGVDERWPLSGAAEDVL